MKRFTHDHQKLLFWNGRRPRLDVKVNKNKTNVRMPLIRQHYMSWWHLSISAKTQLLLTRFWAHFLGPYFRGLNISWPKFFFWQTSFDRNIFWTNFFLGRCLKEDWKMSEKCLYLANCNMMWQLNDLSELVSTFDKLLLIIESLCQLLTTCDGLCWLVTPFKEMRWLLSNCGYFCWLVLI